MVTLRFAPSPTGKLHIGNVRTALINYLFASAQGGRFILRIDDTDQARSTQAYEAAIKEDLTWLGLNWAESFNQSDRFDRYQAAADRLRDMGLLYACYETSEELDRKRKIALSRGRPPVYDRAGLDLSVEARAALEGEGRRPHWRFKLSGGRVDWVDLVRGAQSIDTHSLSDPVLIRDDGSFLYTLPSVVDDIDYQISHIVRGEDHVTNSGAQIEIIQALGGTPPEMAHTSLLIGADGAALSKRLGSLSMDVLREQGIEPMAICSLLAKLGTSENIEPRASLGELAAEFGFDKFGRAPARFDEAELKRLNAAFIREKSFADMQMDLAAIDQRAVQDPAFWETVKANCETVQDIRPWIEIVYGVIAPVIAEEDRAYIEDAIALLPELEFGDGAWRAWTAALKEKTGRKGKALFMPLRKALTGLGYGPDMSALLPLMGRERAKTRLDG